MDEELLCLNGKKIHFKKYGTFNSLEGKSNKRGIRFKDGQLEWLKLKVPEKENKIGSGDVGLDIGTSTLAIASEKEVKIIELADKSQPKQQEINKLMKKLDRSRRATNANNYISTNALQTL